MSRDCPLVQSQLHWMVRLLCFGGAWSYLTAALCTPLFAIVPFVAVAFHAFPVILVPHFVYAFIPYFVTMHAGESRCCALSAGFVQAPSALATWRT